MSWLVLYWTLQLGYLPLQQVNVLDVQGPPHQEQEWQAPSGATEATLGTRVVFWDHVEVGGFIRSYQKMDTGVGDWGAYRIDYGIHAALLLGPFTFWVGHECDHSLDLPLVHNVGVPGELLAMAQTEVGIRFESKVSF